MIFLNYTHWRLHYTTSIQTVDQAAREVGVYVKELKTEFMSYIQEVSLSA